MKTGCRCAQAGFSVVELLLVLGVLSILAAFAVPSIQGTMTAYRLTASANLIAEELDAARVLAISRGAIYEVRFTQRAIAIVDPEDIAHPPRVAKPLEPGVRVAVMPSAAIRFFPRGYARAGDLIIQNQEGSLIRIAVLASGKIEISQPCESLTQN
jgi:prepilin-type N-terminal cleavage/methylation domain-containing protein